MTALDDLVPPPDDTEERFQQVSAEHGLGPSALEPGQPSPATGPLAPPEPPPPPTPYDVIGSARSAQAQIYQRLPYQNRFDRRRSAAELAGLKFQERNAEDTIRAQERSDAAAQRQQDRAERQQETGNRLKASDLASRGIPTYRDATGGPTPVTDESGAPMLHYDKSNNIAYDSTGNPRVLSYESEAGPPALRDPFAGLPLRTDPKTGDQYLERKGLPWQWQGVDPAIKSQRMQEEKDKALTKESQLIGRKLSIDHADLVAGKAEHDAMMKELTASVPTLQDPRLAGADRDTILKTVDDHFNTEYAQPQANETNGWFSKELSPSAQQLRQHIDSRKADAMQTANDLFDLKDNQAALADRVAQGRQQERDQLDTLIAHQEGRPGPLDQPPTPEIAPPSPEQAIAEAKAGRKSYSFDDQNNIQFDPKNLNVSAKQAVDDGLIDPAKYTQLKPQLDELQKVTDEREKLIAAAGKNPQLKALLSGAIQGSAFAAGFPLGAGAGAAIGAFGGPLDPVTVPAGAIIGGLITGGLSAAAARGIIKKVGDYNDTIHSISASSELHPNYDLAGNLISFGAGAFTKGVSKAIGRGAEALGAKLAGASAVEGVTGEQIAENLRKATIISKAAAEGKPVGTASKEWAEKILSDKDPAAIGAKYANAIARSYYGSGGGLWNTVQNLSKDASIRAAQLGDQAGARAQIAKAIAYKVGGAAVANVAIDAIINQGMYAAGLQPQGETWQNAGAAALLGAFTAGHGMEFEGYNKNQVGNILIRGKVRVDNGIGLSENLPPGLIERKMPTFDSQQAAELQKPLTAKEQEVYEAFGFKLRDLKNAGQVDFDINAADVTARQALQGGQPYGVTAVDIRPGEAPPAEAGPPKPTPPTIGAPPEGEPPSAPSQPPKTEVTPPPTVEPPRPPGPQIEPKPPDAGPPTAPGAEVTPPGYVPPTGPVGGTTGAGAVAPGGGGGAPSPEPAPAPGGPTPVPPAAPEPGKETAQPTAVPEPVTEFPKIEEPGPVVTPPPTPQTVDEAAHQAATSPLNDLPHPTHAERAAGNYQKGHAEVGVEGGAKLPITFENPVGSQRTNLDVPAVHELSDQVDKAVAKAAGVGAGAKPSLELAISSAEKGNFELAKTQLGAAGRWLRQNGHPELADKVDALNSKSWATELQSHYGYIADSKITGADKEHMDVFVKEGTPVDQEHKVHVIDQVYPKDAGAKAGKFDEHKVVIGAANKQEAVAEYQKNYQPGARGNFSGVTEFPNIAAFREWAESLAAKRPAAEYKAPAVTPPAKPKGTPQVPPLPGMGPLGAKPPTEPTKVPSHHEILETGKIVYWDRASHTPELKDGWSSTFIDTATAKVLTKGGKHYAVPESLTKDTARNVDLDALLDVTNNTSDKAILYAKDIQSVTPAEVERSGDGWKIVTKGSVEYGVAKPKKEEQPPPSGPKPETLPPTETPPTAGEGGPGVGGAVQPGEPGHDEAERAVKKFHEALPRGIRVSQLSGRSVPLVRVPREKLEHTGGLAARFIPATGEASLIYAPEIVEEALIAHQTRLILEGKTPEEAKEAALSLIARGMAGEAAHVREQIISGGTNLASDRERVWKEMHPIARKLMPQVYDSEIPAEARNRVLAAEYVRMKFQLAHGIMPEEADINPDEFSKLLPILQEKESPWIESHLRAMDDLTKQDTELPFRNDDLNELYKFHEKKGLSDAQAQAAVIADALAGYDDIQEAADAADVAPPDYVHTTESDHEISNEAFKEVIERANAQEQTSTTIPLPPKPEVVSKIPRKPPIVPESIGGPGPISDTDMSQAEVVPQYEGTGDLGHEYIAMPDGSQIPVTYKLVDSRLVVDNPTNEQPDASFKETQDYLLQTTGEPNPATKKPGYDARFPFTRDPSFLQGPGVAIAVEGRFMKLGGHRRHYRDLIMREKYESELAKKAAAFGINPKFVKDMQDKGGWPYLMAIVDEILTPEQQGAIGRHLNTSKEQPKIEAFEAISAGRQLSPETLDTAGHLFEQNFDKTPLAMLQTAGASDLVEAMFKDGALRESDRSKYIADDGGFTEQGAKFARLVLVGHLIDDVQTLDNITGKDAMTKLINGLSQLYIMKRRGQDMGKITHMLKMEKERMDKKLTATQYLQLQDQLLMDRRYADVEAIFEWFNSFKAPQAKKSFQKVVNDYFPLEKGQEDMVAKNIDLGEGLIRDKNLETLSMMKPGKFGGMTAEERVLKTLKEKEAKGVKLTTAEHDLVLKIEKKLGQKLLIDPNKTPRKEQEPDVFPEETKPVEPPRAKLGGQTDLDIISQGIEKSGQQTLFMLKPKSQPPVRPRLGEGKTFAEGVQKLRDYNRDLEKWVENVPAHQPLVFTNPDRPNRSAYVSPVVPRAAPELGEKPRVVPAPTKPGDWRVTWFEKMVKVGGEGVAPGKVAESWVEPVGHDEYSSKVDAVKAALLAYPRFAPDTLFMAKPKGPSLPGMENLPEIQWKEGPSGDIWDGVATKTGVAYMITEVTDGVFQIHYFNPDGGGASDIGSEKDLHTAKKQAETHYSMWKADNRNRPARAESIKLVGPRAKASKEQQELRFGAPEGKRIAQNKPVSLQLSRGGMTQTSPVNFLPARFMKIAKPHQQWGANLALWAFDGGTGFLNNDGPGAGKTLQQLMVAHIMANTKAQAPIIPKDEGQITYPYSKEHGLSPRRKPLPAGMTHASLIVTENERIIQNAFAKDAEMLGIDAWRYMGDDPQSDRVYLATYNDLRSGRVRPGQFRTVIFDEAQGLRNAGYETAQALAGTKIGAMAQHVMYATATPFDKPEQIVYLAPLVGDAAIEQVFNDLGITIQKGAVDPKTGKADVRFKYPDDITAKDIEDLKEAIFNELTRRGKMISRNVPLDNVTVNFVEVPLSDQAFLHADAMYQRIYGAIAIKSAQNAGGVAGMAVRGYLETQKIEATMKLVRESIKAGRQVVIFASRIKQGTEGSYHEGIEGTLDKMFAMLEQEFGKGTIGRVYGGDNKRSIRDIDRFQRNEIHTMLATPNSAGTGINLDDTFGDVPRDMIIITAPLSAIEAIQDIGRINRLTTLSSGDVKFLFVDHPVDTWNIDILADKLITLSATVAGDLKNIKPLEQRTAEIKLNDDSVALMTVFQREPMFQKIMRQMRTGEPGFISEQEARERLTSPNKAVREDARARVDKFLKDIQDETDRQRNNAKQMSEDEIMELVDDEAAFSALSPGHAYFQEELAKFVKANSLYPTHAEMLRALGAQMKGDLLLRIDFAIRKMKPLGMGGGTYGGRGRLILQEKGKKAKINPYLSNDMGKVTLHEYGHVGYFVMLSVAERRYVARMYAKLGGRSGTQAYFVQGTPQASTSKSRYYSKNVYEFFAESFAQYVMEKRVPGEIMTRFHERILKQFKQNFEMLRRRKDITRDPGLLAIYEKILDLKKNAKHIDYSYPDRASLLLSTKPPKGLSRGEMERWLAHKASIYNSLALNRPPTYRQPHELEKGEHLWKPKLSPIQEKVTPRARQLPSGEKPIVPQTSALALRQPLPKAMLKPGELRPVATETMKGGQKNHFFITSTPAGHSLFMREGSSGPLHARVGPLKDYDAVMGVLKTTLEAGAKAGSKHVYHPTEPPEISSMLRPRGPRPIAAQNLRAGDVVKEPGLVGGVYEKTVARVERPYGDTTNVHFTDGSSVKYTGSRTLNVIKRGEIYAIKEPGAAGVGVRGEGGEVGEGAPLRQPGEIAREGETQKKEAVTTGRGGGVPLDPADPGQIGAPEPDVMAILSPKQRQKVAGAFASAKKATGVNWVFSALKDIQGLAPTAKSPEHLQAAQDVGRFLGERNRGQEIAKRLIRKSWKMFVKLGANREDLPFDQHPGSKFVSDVSSGRPLTGEFKEAADLYHKLFQERILEAERAGAPISATYDDYFPGYWTIDSRRAFNQAMDELIPEDEKATVDVNNLSEAKMGEIRQRVEELMKQNGGSDANDWMRAFARRPLKGSEKFRHEKVFYKDQMIARKLGLQPTYPNPADAVMAKLHELDQSILANKLIQKWKRDGKLQIIHPMAKPPDGWREFPDPFGRVWAKSEGYGLQLVGKRIVPNEYADIVENFLSPSLYDSRYFGKPFSLWMNFANVLNQTQLGIGSAFHAGFTAMETQVSTIARMLQDMYGVMRGNRTMGDLGKTLKEVPTAMFTTPKLGDAVLNAYMDRTPSQDPRINQVVRALELAGAGKSIEKGLKTEQGDAAFRDYYSGHKIRAAMRSPVALIENLAKPIMEFLVPRQKYGVFAQEAWRLIDRNPGKSLEELTPQFRFLWSTVDARLGQVQYNRLFLNRIAKNVVQMFTRAPGWTGGTILQLGGSIKDAGTFFKEWADTGSLPKDLPPRTAYAIALVATVAAMNAVLTFLFTGKHPESKEDFFSFRTGREDEQGNPERFVLPTYMKDLWSYGKHPGETILNKTHPAISLMGEIFRNKDYYGVQVRDEDANFVKQAYQSGKHIVKAFQPFWWRGAVRASERGKGLPERVIPLIGVMPAPRSLTQTPASAEVEKYWKTHQPESGISPEQFETQQTKRKLVRQIRQGGSANITEAINKGAIQPRDINALYKRARLGSLGSSVDRMPLVAAEKVYAAANPTERAQLAGILERKRAGSLRRGGRTMYQGF